MNFIKNFFFVIFVALAMGGCASEPKDKAEDVAVAFFYAIYNQNDINKAQKLCTTNFAKQISNYVTAKSVARRLFNMSFDSVKIDAALGDLKVRDEFKSSGKLTILFTGHRQGKIYKELKSIKLIKKGDIWLIEKLLPDTIPN